MSAGGECKGDLASESKYADGGVDRDAKKHQDPGGGGGGGGGNPIPPPLLQLLSVECGPSDCPVDERLELSMDFTLDQPLRGALWEIKFLVDSVNERHLVRLGATDPTDYERGACSMHFQVSKVPVEGIQPCTLANTGLLVAVLKRLRDGGGRGDAEGKGEEKAAERWGEGLEDVATVNLVVQVADAGGGGLMRCIYSPLE